MRVCGLTSNGRKETVAGDFHQGLHTGMMQNSVGVKHFSFLPEMYLSNILFLTYFPIYQS